MEECESYNPNNIFQRFKLIEFPVSFVGLSTFQVVDVEVDLTCSAYLKTSNANQLMKFELARETSASHRAYQVEVVDEFTIKITFLPTTECISKAIRSKSFNNRFVFDLRLIKVDGTHCCSSEHHAEIGRYYISGRFEYCDVTHYPQVIDFGDVIMNTQVKKYVVLRNNSNLIAAKISYRRVLGFEVFPAKFLINPNSSKRILITVKPTCLKLRKAIPFEIRNEHDCFDGQDSTDPASLSNFIEYKILSNFNIIYKARPKEILVESLHRLYEKDPRYTYLDKELDMHIKQKAQAAQFLRPSNSDKKKPALRESIIQYDKCYSEVLETKKLSNAFCKQPKNKLSTYDLFDITINPSVIDFGNIGLLSYGDCNIIVKNNSTCDISIQLLRDECVLYTEDLLVNTNLKIPPKSEISCYIYCLGFVEGHYSGTFEYNINKKFHKKHPYKLNVGTPTLMVLDKNLKFGMVTAENFINSVPVKIYNLYNTPISFKWDLANTDLPCDVIPQTGMVPKHSAKVCDMFYVCKESKMKNHEIDLISIASSEVVIPLEISVSSRKLSVKFITQVVIFKDISLNLETCETVRMENSSREIALFHVVEPLIPGFKVEPMSGVILPKMIICFQLIVKISCVLEFAFDICVKINNKENVILPVSGNVIEPKLSVYPKNIYITRIPSYMITYVPVSFQNSGTVKAIVEMLGNNDENVFDTYVSQGNDKEIINEFTLECGQTKTLFIKIYDTYRREYEMFIPFIVNGLLGPPQSSSITIVHNYYTGQYEQLYDHNPKVKVKKVSRDITFCRISGVITVPWLQFSVDNFEIDFVPNTANTLPFSITNVSKYSLPITIQTGKLYPHFTLILHTEGSITTETIIKIELLPDEIAEFILQFHPRGHGVFVSTALMYMDKQLQTPFHNLTFTGRRQVPLMIPSTHSLIFPPCLVGTNLSRQITLKMNEASELEDYNCDSKEEPNLKIEFVECKKIIIHDIASSEVTVNILISCDSAYARKLTVSFHHSCGSTCEIEIHFCFTYCSLSLHTRSLVSIEDNPYPYYPLETQTELYDYMEYCTKFLERWMYQQGFRRDLCPVIPETFYDISSAMSSQNTGTGKIKGINVSYMNFVKRIAGPLMKHIRKIVITEGSDETSKCVKEIHDTYKEIIYLLRSRGANLWALQARFLLSHEQFLIHSHNVVPKGNADVILTQKLQNDAELFRRISKQSWIDFILQSYKVFILDSCFFECVCMSSQPRDITKVLIDWYNDHIRLIHNKLRKNIKTPKVITDLTVDLRDGIAIISAILVYCPFLENHFSLFCEIDDNEIEGCIINNACLIVEALNNLRFYFPLRTTDLLKPNYLQMMFLSIHLYVTLPMFIPKDTIKFNPPILRTSTRQVAINPTSQESLTCTCIIINNYKGSFAVEKGPSADNSRKMYITVKYTANFVKEEKSILLVHGYNKTRIFDTYVVFMLEGQVGALYPLRKCKVTGSLYRPNRIDVLVTSPFPQTSVFKVIITDIEPTIPVVFKEPVKPIFFVRRLSAIDKEITLIGVPKETGAEIQEHKLFVHLICLSTQVGNSWIWFRSDVGEFFVRVTTQPRWDLPIETFQVMMKSWPVDPCNCGESCECYRTSVLVIPHRNELMIKSLRYALLEYASNTMIEVYDKLIETPTGKIVICMLLQENGTHMSEVNHILCNEINYRITSRSLVPRIDRAVLEHHTNAILTLPVTIPYQEKADKYTVTFTSDCGMDIRTYRILFMTPTIDTVNSSDNSQCTTSE